MNRPPFDLTKKQAVWWLVVIFALGFVLRVFATYEWPMGINHFSDDNGYLNSGATFLKTGYVTYAKPNVPSGVLGPGMPILLGMIFAVFGYQPEGLMASHVAFAGIGLLTALGLYLLGALLHSRLAGVVASAFGALDFGLVSTNSAFYTETPFMCLMVFGLYFFLKSVLDWRLGRYLAGVACFCAAMAFKGLALLLPPCILAYLLYRRVKLSKWLPQAVLLVVISALVFLPWCVRNQQIIGVFTPFPTSQGDQKLLGTYVGVGYPDGTYEEALEKLDAMAWEQGYQTDTIHRIKDRGEYGQERLAQWIAQNPLGFLFTHLLYKPVSLLILPFYPHKTLHVPLRLVNLCWWVLLVLALWGVLSGKLTGKKSYPGFYVPLILLALSVWVPSLMVPLARYNAANMPFVMLYAAIGIANGLPLIHRDKSRSLQERMEKST
ncbi:MAG: glycosyltransferase family 39 protein [Clostridiales bacterium]|nr:glycosyltransferase family 39 protein [Clostridiales bacterium]